MTNEEFVRYTQYQVDEQTSIATCTQTGKHTACGASDHLRELQVTFPPFVIHHIKWCYGGRWFLRHCKGE